MSITIKINSKSHLVTKDQLDMPLLWYIRESLKLKGTKFGCGIGQCGACTVHFNGKALRSCSVPVKAAINGEITTIEGITSESDALHPVQEAWKALDVPQCGYCQPGQIMSAIALLEAHPSPSDKNIEDKMTNICRCGTYTRIRKAIKLAAQMQIEAVSIN